MQLAQGPTQAIGLIKRAMNKAMTVDLDGYLEYEANFKKSPDARNDYKEGVSAFLEKRPAAVYRQIISPNIGLKRLKPNLHSATIRSQLAH